MASSDDEEEDTESKTFGGKRRNLNSSDKMREYRKQHAEDFADLADCLPSEEEDIGISISKKSRSEILTGAVEYIEFLTKQISVYKDDAKNWRRRHEKLEKKVKKMKKKEAERKRKNDPEGGASAHSSYNNEGEESDSSDDNTRTSTYSGRTEEANAQR